MLEVVGLAATYGDVPALWDVSLAVRAGEAVALIGANGAGKSTLMRAIAGLHRPSSGAIHLNDERIDGLAAHAIAERAVRLVPEGRRLFGTLSVRENLEVGAYTGAARGASAATMAAVHALFPILAERGASPASTLSGGQQQMLAIGRALMGLPRLLLLDEPSLGLAPMVVQQIFGALTRIRRESGITVLLVEQNARLALEFADRAYVMERGRTILEGAADVMLRDPRVRAAYLGYAPMPAAS